MNDPSTESQEVASVWSSPWPWCELCECSSCYNFHHLIPRTLHSNKWFRRRRSREQMARGLWLCKGWQKTIHELISSEKELGRHYNTREKLADHEGIAKYLRWKRRRSG